MNYSKEQEFEQLVAEGIINQKVIDKKIDFLKKMDIKTVSLDFLKKNIKDFVFDPKILDNFISKVKEYQCLNGEKNEEYNTLCKKKFIELLWYLTAGERKRHPIDYEIIKGAMQCFDKDKFCCRRFNSSDDKKTMNNLLQGQQEKINEGTMQFLNNSLCFYNYKNTEAINVNNKFYKKVIKKLINITFNPQLLNNINQTIQQIENNCQEKLLRFQQDNKNTTNNSTTYSDREKIIKKQKRYNKKGKLISLKTQQERLETTQI